jgi:hypothetical protein
MSRSKRRTPTTNALQASACPERRLVGRIADIAIAVDDIREMLRQTPRRRGPRDDLESALSQIESATAAMLLQLPAAGPSAERDPELAVVLVHLETRLQLLTTLRGPARDETLAKIERLAAPYALAFLGEIQRLDSLLERPRNAANDSQEK